LNGRCGPPHTHEVGNAQQDNRFEEIGPKDGTILGDDGSPVVTDDARSGLAQCIDQADNISGELKNVIIADRRRAIRLAVTALVRGNGVKTGFSQSR